MKTVTEAEIAILAEHLPYEIDMLEKAFAFLHDPNLAAARQDKFARNAAIEAFWIHARNLIEFLTHPPEEGATGVVSARDFAGKYRSKLDMDTLDDQINAQICHLTYERKSSPAEKLGVYEMLRVKPAIDSDIRRFEKDMEDRYRKFWTPRQPSQQSWVSVQDTMTSAMTATMTGTFNVYK